MSWDDSRRAEGQYRCGDRRRRHRKHQRAAQYHADDVADLLVAQVPLDRFLGRSHRVLLERLVVDGQLLCPDVLDRCREVLVVLVDLGLQLLAVLLLEFGEGLYHGGRFVQVVNQVQFLLHAVDVFLHRSQRHTEVLGLCFHHLPESRLVAAFEVRQQRLLIVRLTVELDLPLALQVRWFQVRRPRDLDDECAIDLGHRKLPPYLVR